jgi:drug/metabolite transporter (DMT)-like permease
MLFLYAAPFSFAYLQLSAGTGALILVGAVQMTIILVSLISGDRPSREEWLGILLACGGFVYLVLPGISAPPLVGFLLMSLAGMAWGFYTLIGRKSSQALADTAFNFTRSLLFVALLVPFAIGGMPLSPHGVLLAIASGALASGGGYAIWYSVLPSLSPSQSAVVQLVFPLLTASAGAAFLSETITMRFAIAAAMILSGLGLVVRRRKSNHRAQQMAIETEILKDSSLIRTKATEVL